MSEPHADDQQALLVGIARVQTSVGEFREDLAELRSYGQRSRVLIAMVGVLSAIVCALAIVTAFVADSAHDASDAAHRNRQTAISACQAANDSREQNRQLWMYVVTLVTAANPSPTSAQVKAIDGFKDKINATFAQRDCNAANPYTTPPSH